MQEPLQYIVPVEVREADDGPKLRGVVLQEGRAAQGGRAELFSALQLLSGRLTASALSRRTSGGGTGASQPSRPVTRMVRFASKHAQPRRSSPPTPHASFSVLSFTRCGTGRTTRMAGAVQTIPNGRGPERDLWPQPLVLSPPF